MMNKRARNISQSVALPDGGVIAISNCLIGDEDKIIPIYDHNHNIFRLDKDGNVVWQVQRDDKGRINWEHIMAEVAKGDKGNPESIRRSRWPFTNQWGQTRLILAKQAVILASSLIQKADHCHGTSSSFCVGWSSSTHYYSWQ